MDSPDATDSVHVDGVSDCVQKCVCIPSVVTSAAERMRAHCESCERTYKDDVYCIFGRRCHDVVELFYDPKDSIFHTRMKVGAKCSCGSGGFLSTSTATPIVNLHAGGTSEVPHGLQRKGIW